MFLFEEDADLFVDSYYQHRVEFCKKIVQVSNKRFEFNVGGSVTIGIIANVTKTN